MCALKLDQLQYVKAIREGDFSGLPISATPTSVNLTGSWKFFRPHLVEKDSPCREACPLKVPVAAYARELAAGNREAALKLLRRANPLPAVTGRVCPHFCQQACNRAEFDAAVNIGDLERALGDFGLDRPLSPAAGDSPAAGKRAAVIGAGPAGIGAAVFLARAGAEVTIFEKQDRPGGLLEQAIPAYRLPREILKRELDNLFSSYPNITLQCGRAVNVAELEALASEFAAVILAIGLPGSLIPPEWQGCSRVIGALELLEKISRQQEIAGKRFRVSGGGNAALDAARARKRLGREVEIIYRRSRERMPAYAEEKEQAAAEGIPIRTETVVGDLIETAAGLSVSLYRAETADNGAIKPGAFIEKLAADCLVAATGQAADPAFADISGPLRDRLIRAGDCAHGAATVAEALASGRAAAAAALARISGEKAENSRPAATPAAGCEKVVFSRLHLDYCAPETVPAPAQLAVEKRLTGFSEIRAGLDPEELEKAARRCFSCGTCTACGLCWFFCPEVAIAISPGDRENPPAALFDLDHCKGCGQCAEICPRGVIEMEEDL
jgi:NADPH-dependent glutamate synthase beta subunit-like oxidoreductase